MKKKHQDTAAAIILFGLLAAVFGCGGRAESADFGASATLQATELSQAFEEDESWAERHYGGRRVRVTGKVSSIIARPDGRLALDFRTSIHSFTPTRCYFDAADGEDLSDIPSNMEIAAEGTVVGMDETQGSIVLENCRLP